MSIFASRTRKTLEMTFDDERQPDGSCHTVTIQSLSGRQMKQARDAGMAEQLRSLKASGLGEFQREMASVPQSTAAEIAKAVEEISARQAADPSSGLDKDVLLEKGIVEWTYDSDVTPEARADLDPRASDFLADAIARLTPQRQTREAQKNDSSPSIEA